MFDEATWTEPTNLKRPVVHPVHSLEDLRDWLEEQDPDKTYRYCGDGNCLNAQYCRVRRVKYRIPLVLSSPGYEIEQVAYYAHPRHLRRCPRSL